MPRRVLMRIQHHHQSHIHRGGAFSGAPPPGHSTLGIKVRFEPSYWMRSAGAVMGTAGACEFPLARVCADPVTTALTGRRSTPIHTTKRQLDHGPNLWAVVSEFCTKRSYFCLLRWLSGTGNWLDGGKCTPRSLHHPHPPNTPPIRLCSQQATCCALSFLCIARFTGIIIISPN